MNESQKRVFFAVEVRAPWPEQLPSGRILDPEDRHATLAFLGEVPFTPLLQQLNDFNYPKPSFKVGLVGKFSQCLFLPPRHPNVVAWDVEWLDDSRVLVEYRLTFVDWLKSLKYYPKEHPGSWLCHVTLSRKPFDYHAWKNSFKQIPMAIYGIHLYESMGHSKYKPIWSHPLIPPFQEIEHTADIAYLINGENMTQLYRHAQTALVFRYPQLLPYIRTGIIDNHDEMIIALNEIVTEADGSIGCPFKAISFHGHIEEKESVFQWEMIVDV